MFKIKYFFLVNCFLVSIVICQEPEKQAVYTPEPVTSEWSAEELEYLKDLESGDFINSKVSVDGIKSKLMKKTALDSLRERFSDYGVVLLLQWFKLKQKAKKYAFSFAKFYIFLQQKIKEKLGV